MPKGFLGTKEGLIYTIQFKGVSIYVKSLRAAIVGECTFLYYLEKAKIRVMGFKKEIALLCISPLNTKLLVIHDAFGIQPLQLGERKLSLSYM